MEAVLALPETGHGARAAVVVHAVLAQVEGADGARVGGHAVGTHGDDLLQGIEGAGGSSGATLGLVAVGGGVTAIVAAVVVARSASLLLQKKRER